MIMIDVKVVPGSGRIAWKREGDLLKCYVKSPAENGKANRELIGLIAKALGIPVRDVTIILGATARKKRIRIDAVVTRAMILEKLGIVQQMSLFS